ncbi:hypothetical protein V2J09_017008 [Rumex salicifolius]
MFQYQSASTEECFQIFIMDPSNQNEEDQVVVHDFFPRFRVYKSGRVQRLQVFQFVPASSDPDQNVTVLSKDVVVSPETGVSVRIFLPAEARRSSLKLPLLIYAHGGAFCLQSAFSSTFHNYVTTLVSQANVIAVSMDYRLAPENPIPACYEDSWAVVQWAAAHQNSNGPDRWLNEHADFSRVFLAGDSAGANIIHNTLIQIGSDPHPLLKIRGAALVHPFFGNHEPDELWEYLCQDNVSICEPRLNPTIDPNRLGRIPVERMLVCLAGDDHLRGRGVSYHEALKESAWSGDVEVFETEGEGHVFHLFHPNCEKALALFKRIALFLNQLELGE